MIHMVVCESSHGKVAVVVVRLISDIDTFFLPNLPCRCNEVFW